MSGCNGRHSPEFSPGLSNAITVDPSDVKVDRKELIRARVLFHPQPRCVVLVFNPTSLVLRGRDATAGFHCRAWSWRPMAAACVGGSARSSAPGRISEFPIGPRLPTPIGSL